MRLDQLQEEALESIFSIDSESVKEGLKEWWSTVCHWTEPFHVTHDAMTKIRADILVEAMERK